MPSNGATEAAVTLRPFIWIRYGDDQKILINLWCSLEILLNYILTKCKIADETIFDICDSSGKLLGLNEAQSSQHLIQSFEEGGTYILVSLDNESLDKKDDIQPLLKNYESYYPNLLDQIWQSIHDKGDKYSKKKYGKRGAQQIKVSPVRKSRK